MKPLQKASLHFKRGEHEQVEQVCAKLLATDPEDHRAWQLRGVSALHLKQFEAAAIYFQESLARLQTARGFVNLAVALLTLDKPLEAAQAAERALALDPRHAGAYLNLGASYLRQHRFEDAWDAVERCLQLEPRLPKGLDMQARIALKLGKVDQAVELATTALSLDPTLSVSHRVLADIAMGRMDYDLARSHYEHALRNNPDDPETHGNLALLLARSGEYESAIPRYKRALADLRKDASLHVGLADMLLIHGRFAEGWPQYGWRHLRSDNSLQLVDQPFPQSIPEGGSATVVLDQGLGDQILMASLIPELAAKIPNLEVQCDPRLITLFQRSFPAALFTPHRTRSTPDAVATPGSFAVADIGALLRRDFESFPRHSGYLKPSETLTRELRQRYVQKSRPLVGVSWATRRGAKLAPHKSVSLQEWGPLLSMPGVTFVNLQYDSDPAEVAEAAQQFGANIITDPAVSANGDMDMFAAQVAAMDLVIATSSAAAHMAGALNVPTWVFVPTGFGGLWHWFLQREDSPWYPSVRLFRQTTRGDWRGVIDRASTQFLSFVENWPAQTS